MADGTARVRSAMSTFRAVIEADLPTLQGKLRSATSRGEQARIVAGIVAKAAVTLLFCLVFVLAFVAVLGQTNAIVGVVVLLSVLTFQKVHFGYSTSQGALALFLIFLLFAVAPPAALAAGSVGGAVINAISILLIVILACDRVELHNHIVLVLSYLLLYGYPVAEEPALWLGVGQQQWLRVAGLVVGGVWAASILYRKHAHMRQELAQRSIGQVFRDFRPSRPEDEWKLKLALLVPLAMLVGQLLGFERTMWIGIVAMSVLSPFEHLRANKMVERFVGTILGVVLFYLFTLIPGMTPLVVGLTGGFLVGLTTSYRYQTVFNSLGALSVAMLLLGTQESIWVRILDTAFAIGFVLIVVFVLDWVIDRVSGVGGRVRP